MKRRDFVRKSMGASLAAGSAMAVNPCWKAFGRSQAQPSYDLVAVKGGGPGVMFDRAIQSLGGMEKYVKKGQTVVIKPNIGWVALPERAANTNPVLVGRIVEHCFAAGAKDVLVFESNTESFNDYLARVIGGLGVEARDAADNASRQGMVVRQFQNLRDSTSGVSLDEELFSQENGVQYEIAVPVLNPPSGDVLEAIFVAWVKARNPGG